MRLLGWKVIKIPILREFYLGQFEPTGSVFDHGRLYLRHNTSTWQDDLSGVTDLGFGGWLKSHNLE